MVLINWYDGLLLVSNCAAGSTTNWQPCTGFVGRHGGIDGSCVYNVLLNYINLRLTNHSETDCRTFSYCLQPKEVRITYVLIAVIHTCRYNGIMRCVLSPHNDSGNFVYVPKFNSPEVFLILTKYATMTSWVFLKETGRFLQKYQTLA